MATWIGGGNNRATNPNDWSPTGVPQPGDTMTIGASPSPSLIFQGGDYSQNDLQVLPPNPVDIKLSHDAIVTAHVSEPSNATVGATAEFDISNNVTLNLVESNGSFGEGPAQSVTVDLASNAKWTGSFDVLGPASSLTINGGNKAQFILASTSSIGALATPLNGSHVVINTDVGGSGILDDGGNLELNGTVGSSVIVRMVNGNMPNNTSIGAVAKIDQPNNFLGTVQIDAPKTEIDLIGLANADSYTFQNDMLNIYAYNTVIASIHVTDQFFNLAVVKSGSNVDLIASESSQTLPGQLPIHTG